MQQRMQLLSGRHTLPRHPGIDLQVDAQRSRITTPLVNGGRKPFHLLLRPHDRRQPMPNDGLGLLVENSGHDHNPRSSLQRRDGLANSHSLNRIRDPQPLHPGPGQHRRTHPRAMTICIRLHHRKHRCLATSGLGQ